MSTLHVNKLKAAVGTTVNIESGHKITGASGAMAIAGSTIQTQFTQYASKVTQSYSADTPTAITGMTVNITPKFANSAIKLVGTWGGEIADNGLWDHVFFFYRDSTQIPPSSDFPDYASKPNQPFGLGCAGETYYAGADNSSTPNYVNIQYYDFPNTTSQITYKLGIRLTAVVLFI